MRTIKFRCWFADKMYYAIPAIWFTREGVKVVNLNHDPEDFTQGYDTWTGHDDYHLMQFTGLKDKNGKEIYEGDIIQNVSVDGKRFSKFEIIWSQQSCGFMKYRDDGNVYYLEESKWYEVIGNIHENPNLL